MNKTISTLFLLLVTVTIIVLAKPRRRAINSPYAPKAIGPYSQAIQYGNTLYLSGQIGIDPSTGKVVPGGIKQETVQVMNNIGQVLIASNSTFSDVLTCNVLLDDLNNFQVVNEIYADYFVGMDPPARATFQVSKLPANALVEISCIAASNSDDE